MNEYRKLKEKHQEEINKFPLGFAFSNEQFDKMMKNWGLTPEDTDKIYRLPGGGYVQKKDHKALHEMFDRHAKEREEAIKEDETGEGFIFHMFLDELRNHEYGYTEDLEDTLDVLGYTMEEIEADKRLTKGLEKAIEVIRGRE